MHGARPASNDDLAVIADLLRQAVSATPVGRGGHLFRRASRDVDVDRRLGEALESPRRGLFAGTIDDVVTGFALVGLAERIADIEELYVEPLAREVGVGEALIEACVSWATDLGADAIDYEALPGDRRTKNLGERSGFVARLIVMHRDLRPVP